jgi:outer membrane murein-binding lipoprotein Lpp
VGQQQLLLIVLSVIIVGIAVVIGLGLFSEGANQANIDQVVQDVLNMGARAQQYYMKPVALGGGGRSFVGISVDDIGAAVNRNGDEYVVSGAAAAAVTITGTCSTALMDDDTTKVNVVAAVTPVDVTTTINTTSGG